MATYSFPMTLDYTLSIEATIHEHHVYRDIRTYTENDVITCSREIAETQWLLQ